MTTSPESAAPSSPPFPTFILPSPTLAALYSTHFGDPALRVIFSAGAFPIHYTSDFDPPTTHHHLTHIFAIRSTLSYLDITAYHQWLYRLGLVPRIPITLTGTCVATSKDRHPDCRHFYKWTCGGCGRTHVPGSLRDPACTRHPDPWWASYLSLEIAHAIEQHSVSSTDPLIWFPDGIHPHGRTIRHTPTLYPRYTSALATSPPSS